MNLHMDRGFIKLEGYNLWSQHYIESFGGKNCKTRTNNEGNSPNQNGRKSTNGLSESTTEYMEKSSTSLGNSEHSQDPEARVLFGDRFESEGLKLNEETNRKESHETCKKKKGKTI